MPRVQPKKRKRKASKRGPGQPTKYKAQYCQKARELCTQGATDVEIADALKVSARTLYRWQAEHPEFCQALKLGKDVADERVVRSLFHRAVGYEFDSVKIMQDKGRPVIVPFREHVPADPGAAFNWLKNRRPTEWRDKLDIDATVRAKDVSAEPLAAEAWDERYGTGRTS
jgi:Homeodomain-like domain